MERKITRRRKKKRVKGLKITEKRGKFTDKTTGSGLKGRHNGAEKGVTGRERTPL